MSGIVVNRMSEQLIIVNQGGIAELPSLYRGGSFFYLGILPNFKKSYYCTCSIFSNRKSALIDRHIKKGDIYDEEKHFN
ncbi:hypothetical protein BLX88_22790 [Bacillus obstructivus]|uniref:Uncharacterized protein n=1 Tax=Heyndrickxia oleronia TaxID=38875 RepID=A0A8E2IAA2_9BACI|nr:hypothetical protein BLX88_22790 [Bacillus obstructivus]OOP69207.1 hypothetical protein BWZ43_06350 [Heyndrickxia oleronia]